MKNILTICLLFATALAYTQDKQPTYKAEGDLVKATYYHEDGSISTQGFFKDKKLTGEWTRFDSKGNKTQTAYYKNGNKVGTWLIWSKDSLKEINYDNNTVVNVNLWKHEAKIVAQN